MQNELLFDDKHLFHLLAEDTGDSDGKVQRGQIFPCFQSDDGLAGNGNLGGKLFLGHFISLEPKLADGVAYLLFIVKHGRLPYGRG